MASATRLGTPMTVKEMGPAATVAGEAFVVIDGLPD
jgi:hypothetical protein